MCVLCHKIRIWPKNAFGIPTAVATFNVSLLLRRHAHTTGYKQVCSIVGVRHVGIIGTDSAHQSVSFAYLHCNQIFVGACLLHRILDRCFAEQIWKYIMSSMQGRKQRKFFFLFEGELIDLGPWGRKRRKLRPKSGGGFLASAPQASGSVGAL